MDKDDEVRKLILNCESEEPVFSSLGTPYIGENRTTRKIIAMGSSVVPQLSELLSTSSSKVAACIAYCLGRIGDKSAINELEKTLKTYEEKNQKSAFEYSFIDNATRAIELLKGTNNKT